MTDTKEPTTLAQLDEYDRLQQQYHGLPGALKTETTTKRVVPFIGVQTVTTWIIQTLRVPDMGGDLVFIDKMGASGALRLVLPPEVTTAIARQRDALTSKARSRAARERAPKGDASHLLDPAVRKRALEARKANAARRRARKARKAKR